MCRALCGDLLLYGFFIGAVFGVLMYWFVTSPRG